MLKHEKRDTLHTFIVTECNNLIHNLEAITPRTRQKRGLINFMGKMTKYVYGNMDNDDAEEIYAHLKNLDSNMRNGVTATSEQVVINNNILKTAADIKNHTNKQTEIIKKYMGDMTEITNKIIKAEEDTTHAFDCI